MQMRGYQRRKMVLFLQESREITMLDFKSKKALSCLIEAIKDYESDTFSSSNFEVTEKEIDELAAECIYNFIENHLDGVFLDEVLFNMRDC